jgi:FkbM family methyltransferase
MAYSMSRLQKFLQRWRSGQVSYAQCGEDLIVDFIFRSLKKPTPTYLDIGANHPTQINNTYRFYLKGSQGVCIEPDPFLSENIRRKRKRDVVLNIGIAADENANANFYIMTARTLSTFSEAEAQRYVSYGNQKIEQVIQIPCQTVNAVMRQHFPNSVDYVSIDVEGKDLEILQSFDFATYRPAVFCLETLSYTEDKSERKLTEIIDFMLAQDYVVYADTYINSIFVDRKTWETR